MTGFYREVYSGYEISKWPELKDCSICGTKRVAQADPWIVIKECPRCGNIDAVPTDSPMTRPLTVPPEAISWQEVQRLLIGILRQVDGNKVIVHPAEFEVSGLTLIQETDPATGIVTIWFEKQSNEICGDIHRADDGIWQCTKLKDHLDQHGDGTGKSSLEWTNVRWAVPCASVLSLLSLGKELVLCTLAAGHKEKHVGYDSSGERHFW